MWPGATEDAAGVAVVLELARRAARTWADRKPELTLAFVLEAAECLFVLGSRAHIARHRDGLIKNLVADLHAARGADRRLGLQPGGPSGDQLHLAAALLERS